MYRSRSMSLACLAFAFTALAAPVPVTSAAPGPISTDQHVEMVRLARLAAETPGPWRQLPRSLAPGAAPGMSSLSPDARGGAAPPHALASVADSEPGPDLWQPGFGLPSIHEYPAVAIEYHGELVVAGWVRSAGGTKVNFIARWTATGWQPLGEGIGPAFTLLVHNDRLIAADYTGVVSSWDGTAWTRLPDTPIDQLDDLFVLRDTLYLAGTRYPRAGVVLRLDGTRWKDVGGNFDEPVLRLGVFRGQLIAGGRFESNALAPCRYVARFDGTRWSALGAGIDEMQYGAVRAIQEFDGGLVVGGSFASCSGVPTYGIASFDGTSWRALPGSFFGSVYDLMVADQRLWVSGNLGKGVESFDGATWDESLEPLYGFTLGLTTWGGRVVVVGGFDEAGPFGHERGRTSVAVLGAGGWDGLESWTDQQNGLAMNVGAADVQSIVDFRGDLVVSGLIRLAGSANGWKTMRGLARWDGREWQKLGTEIENSVGRLAVIGNDLILAGWVTGTSAEGPIHGAARWDGAAWHPMGVISGGIVWTVCEYDGSIYVGGDGIRLSSGETTTLARWDGTAWLPVPGAPSEPTYNSARVEALKVVDGRLVVGGNFNRAGGLMCAGVAEWDGTGWDRLGDGPGSDVAALAVLDGTLYAGGLGMPGTEPRETEGLKRWTGREWTGLGLEYTQVTALTNYGDRLVIAGLYGTDRFFPGSTNLVAFDGERWSGFGTGISGIPLALCQVGGDLFVGGEFDHAGAVSAFGIARWAGGESQPTPLVEPVHGLSLSASPLTTSESHVRYGLPKTGHVRIEVFDIAGARVATLVDRVAGAGDHEFVWSAGQPAELPKQGVYFLRMRFDQLEKVSKLVVAR